MSSRSQQNFQLIWMILVILCAFTAIFMVFFVSCSRAVTGGDAAGEAQAAMSGAASGELDGSAGGEAQTVQTVQTVPSAASSVVLQETADQGAEYLASFVFLGDSTTYGLAANDALPFTQVWTPESGTLTLTNQSFTDIDYYQDNGVVQQMSIGEAAALRQPEYLVITLGMNGISYMTEEQFRTEYTDLIQTIQAASPNTKIICQSIFPVIDSQVSSDIRNDRIDTANQWVMDIAAQTGSRYLSTCDVLKDETGNLSAGYCNGDGIHLSALGCQTVLQYVRNHGYV